MIRSVLESALKLSKAERILLAERLWDSIADEDAPLRLTIIKQYLWRSEQHMLLSKLSFNDSGQSGKCSDRRHLPSQGL